MRYQRSVRIRATPERVWAALIDIARWPSWTASVTTAEALGPEPLAVGARFRLKQPRLAPAVWVVTEVDEGRSFVWASANPGVRVIARHTLTPDEDGVTVALEIQQGGVLAPVVGWLTRGLTERYMGLEAEGLRSVCEGHGAPATRSSSPGS